LRAASSSCPSVASCHRALRSARPIDRCDCPRGIHHRGPIRGRVNGGPVFLR